AADARDAPWSRPRLAAVARAGRGARAQTHPKAMAGARPGELAIRPLTAARVDDVKTVTAGTWGATCWDLFPRFTAKQERERGLTGKGEAPRRAALARLARRRQAPGLVACRDGEAIGWIALGPRLAFSAVDVPRATPPVDDVPASVIPSPTLRPG